MAIHSTRTQLAKPRPFLFAALIATISHCASASDIDMLLQVPEHKIDVGFSALVFAKDLHPDLDVAAYSRQIDALAHRARIVAKGSKDPDYRIRALNTFIFKIEGFTYDHSKDANSKIENRFLNGLLDTKKGTCVTLPLLWMAIAQRLGYPVYPVAAPDHLFLRYVESDLKYSNIEATSGGFSPDEELIKDFKITGKALKSGAYMRTMTYRQFLGDLLSETAVNLAVRGNTDKAIRYLKKAVQLNPQFAENHDTLRALYLQKSKQVDGDLVAKYQSKAQQHFMRSEELGLIKLSPQQARKGI
jgi:regulator of sirC expression with transglutaminase-like and TPR domain